MPPLRGVAPKHSDVFEQHREHVGWEAWDFFENAFSQARFVFEHASFFLPALEPLFKPCGERRLPNRGDRLQERGGEHQPRAHAKESPAGNAKGAAATGAIEPREPMFAAGHKCDEQADDHRGREQMGGAAVEHPRQKSEQRNGQQRQWRQGGGVGGRRWAGGYRGFHAAELPVFPVQISCGIGAPHLEEVEAVDAGFFIGRFAGQCEVQRVAFAREGAFKIIRVVSDPNFFRGGLVFGIHQRHPSAEKQAVRLFGQRVIGTGLGRESERAACQPGRAECVQQHHLRFGQWRQQRGLGLGGKFGGSAAQQGAAAGEIQPGQAGAQVGLQKMVEVWAQLPHLARAAAEVKVADFWLQMIKRAAREAGFQFRHMIGKPATERLGVHIFGLALRGVVSRERGEFSSPMFLERRKIHHRQKPRQQNHLRAQARRMAHGGGPIAGEAAAAERGGKGCIKMTARLRETEEAEKEHVGHQHGGEETRRRARAFHPVRERAGEPIAGQKRELRDFGFGEQAIREIHHAGLERLLAGGFRLEVNFHRVTHRQQQQHGGGLEERAIEKARHGHGDPAAEHRRQHDEHRHEWRREHIKIPVRMLMNAEGEQQRCH